MRREIHENERIFLLSGGMDIPIVWLNTNPLLTGCIVEAPCGAFLKKACKNMETSDIERYNRIIFRHSGRVDFS